VTLERGQLGALAALAAVVSVSIFATQLLLVVGVLAFLARLLAGRARFPRTPLDGPTLALCLWTLLSASFSSNPALSHVYSKKLLLFVLLYVAIDSLASDQARDRVLTATFLGGLALAGGALALGRGRWPGRATGTLLAALVIPLGSLALVLSQTRNAWLGTLVGLATVAVVRAPRTLWLLGAAVLAVLALRPDTVMSRLTLMDDSSRDRYYMWQAGIDMIVDKPVFGQGPGMILSVYPSYRWPEAPNPNAPHLHDNALQIAAERGLPCLVFWLWWVAVAMADAWREARRAALPFADPRARESTWPAVAALGVLAAILAAGVFEYNFGDSEVLMFVLLVASLPYALRRQRNLAAGAPA